MIVHLCVGSVRHTFCLQRPHLNKKLVWGICIVFIGRDVLFFFFFGRFLYFIIYFLFIFTSFSLRIVFQIYLDFFLFNKCSENTLLNVWVICIHLAWSGTPKCCSSFRTVWRAHLKLPVYLGKLFAGKLTSITQQSHAEECSAYIPRPYQPILMHAL